MAKRFIGIDLEGRDVRVAILTATPSKIDVELDKRSYDSPEEAAAAITEMGGGKIILGDRLVTALPCRVGLFRRLHFPFREKNKIAAALPLELDSQLPIQLDEHHISFMTPRPRENDYEVDTVVVNKREIGELLTHFPDSGQNPRRIDIFPFAFLASLQGQDGILLYCRRLEVVVALIYDGIIRDYRLLPGTHELAETETFEFIAQQVSQLENDIGHDDLPLWITGAGVTEELLVLIYKTERIILTPCKDAFGEEISCEMTPAALLALSEMGDRKKNTELNFRTAEYAAIGQFEIFKAKLVAVAMLSLLVVAGVVFTMYLGYLQQTREEESLKLQLENSFYQVMPAGAPIVDIPLQLEGELRELRRQVHLFGSADQGAATVLQSISKSVDPEIRVDIHVFDYNSTEVRLSGNADSFDDVDQIAAKIRTNPLFADVKIIDAKLATDNSQVDFELQMRFHGGEK